MNKIVYPFVLCLLLLFYSSCEKENQPEIITNEAGSQIEVVGDIKVSTFKLPNKELAIDRLMMIRHKLRSLTNDAQYEFDGRVKEITSSDIICELHIPVDKVIPDGDYWLLLAAVDDSHIVATQFKLTFENDMVSTILQREPNYKIFKGEGTKDNPYLVDDMLKLSLVLKDDSTHAKGIYFKQDVSELVVPMQGDATDGRGHVSYPFAGNYDGGGNEILSLTYNGASNETKDSDVGLFSALLNGASISNVVLRDVKISNAGTNVGAVAAHSSGTVKLKNITVSGSVKGTNNVGGLIGTASGNLSIEDVTLKLDVSGEGERIGGLIGKGESGLSTTISKVQSTTSFFVKGKGFVGGLIGDIKGSFTIADVVLKYSVEQADEDIAILKATSNYLGGMIGKAKLTGNSSISGSTIKLPIKGVGYVAAYIGDLNTDKSSIGIELVKNEVLQSRISGTNDVGGFVGSWQNVKVNALKDLTQQASVSGTTKAVGGLIGYMNGADWQKDKVSGNAITSVHGITAMEQSAGGVFGYVKNIKKEIDVSPASFSIDKLVSVNGADAVGGIAGRAVNCVFVGDVYFDVDRNQTIKNKKGNSSFSGKINDASEYSGSATSSGGLFGWIDNCTVSGVMGNGVVQGRQRLGGIVGRAVESTLSMCVKKGEWVLAQYNDVGGICGKIEDETVDMRQVLNFSSVKGANCVGGIVGCVEAKNGNISHLINVGDVEGSGKVGGGIGLLKTTTSGNNSKDMVTVEKSVNFGDISGSYKGGEELYGLGGIVGSAYYLVTVKECANHGTVKALSNSTYNGVGGVAGVLGYNEIGGYHYTSSPNIVKIYNCCNTNTVITEGNSSKSRYTLGGVTGRLFYGTNATHNVDMHDCYNTGEVLGKNDRDNGGLLGSIHKYASIHECVNFGRVEHGNGGIGSHPNIEGVNAENLYYLKGTGKGWKATEISKSDAEVSKSYKGFDFDKHWNMNDRPTLIHCEYQFAKMPVWNETGN
ncbi:hypothetical protein M2459_000352 [Parabacteroides sp. PF5-5]|uniref:hypothetical protein n=1 Tax=unclassified Parabacteroides TaxID=2649774 RepID=UPI00247648D9|nr:MULTISPECIES: hypothetical protein [unclassified Parabacteroides]MDH6306365.1 hypothetical protein [Parabacteroides sp. PH5-39]MDH6314637.1 hypothetical protein [Parabacteroides sp. PF5-13]MDH6321076.1 hypothetical protein [Parabacteroides sp. PH5-13]MDH6324808.1 hypothetical protein [Parabacteroides sp. PH5-8]MDH6325511.1 hypothetical protein [Parabacteroides sp. PH5-41]